MLNFCYFLIFSLNLCTVNYKKKKKFFLLFVKIKTVNCDIFVFILTVNDDFGGAEY